MRNLWCGLCRNREAQHFSHSGIVLLLGICVPLIGCEKPASKPKLPANPEYVQVVALLNAPTDKHTIPLVNAEGDTWYWSGHTEVDLSLFRPEKTRVVPGPGERTWEVILVFALEGEYHAARWFARALPATIGILVDGQLICATPMDSRPHRQLAICCFDTKSRAEEVAASVRAAGSP